jgi:hypothetical protein
MVTDDMTRMVQFVKGMDFMQKAIYKWAVEWGFWEENPNFGEKIALIHSELSEALEKHRKHLGKGLEDPPDEHCPCFSGIAVELADAVIRILDLAGKMNLPLAEAIVAKSAFNHTRPKKHGKAY